MLRPMDHTAQARELIAANLARVTAAQRHAVKHGDAHRERVRRRHDDIGGELAALERQIGDDPSQWHHADLHELDELQRERARLARLANLIED